MTRDDIEDLASEGLIALIEAADSYDPDRASFMTHAHTKVRSRILDSVRRWARGEHPLPGEETTEVEAPTSEGVDRIACEALASIAATLDHPLDRMIFDNLVSDEPIAWKALAKRAGYGRYWMILRKRALLAKLKRELS